MLIAQKTKVGLLIGCLCLFFISHQCQVNLVPNPSFETVVGFNPGFPYDEINKAIPWDSLRNGGGGGAVVPGPSFIFAGNVYPQSARTGTFMAGLNYFCPPPCAPWRSYIQAPLNSKLINNKSYCVTGYFNLFNHMRYSIDELSFYLDDGSITSGGGIGLVALANPQIKSPTGIFFNDTLNWMKVQGKFTASGTESYITIGNHKADANLTFSLAYPGEVIIGTQYYVDDISVIDANLTAYAGRDTVLCIGDSVFMGRPAEIGLECLWFNNGTQIATGGGIWIKPAATQTYEVVQDVCGLIKKDTIRVQMKPKYNGPAIGLTANTSTACPTTTINLSIQNNPPITGTYNWLPFGVYTQTNISSANAMIPQNTTFTLNINNLGQDAFCPFQRTASVSVSVPVFTDSPTLISNINPVCPNDTITLSFLNPAIGNTVTAEWLPKASFTFTNNLIAKTLTHTNTNYSVNISSTGNASICAFTRSLSISINVADTCYKAPTIPNIFTPNNDNSNDVWGIKFPFGYTLQELEIYNRWGTLIHKRNNLNFYKQGYALIAWDGYTTSGEPCSAGVYFYVLKYTDRASEIKIAKGNVTLIR